ncbi:MAG TPA: hypothetical protein VJ840_12700, partial [Gemmatimonadaceae bacterium]|nr:hypothetical protein [Gemmatimonadaceae bacterium]
MRLSHCLALATTCKLTLAVFPAIAQTPRGPLSETAIDSARRPRVANDSIAQAIHGLVLVTSDSVDRLRTAQLRVGVSPGQTLLLRSASTLTSGVPGGSSAVIRAIHPQFLAVINSAIPFSQNYGAMWAGRGLSTRTLFGA